jgi:protease IV
MFATLHWLLHILKGTLNAIAMVVTFCVLLFAALFIAGLVEGDGLPRHMVLELDLRTPMGDKTVGGPFDFGPEKLSIMDVVMGLDAAARDPRVSGVFMRVGTGDLSVPKAEELRDALKRFRASGKFLIAHSQGFDSSELGDYVVAAAADEIWMQPASSFFPAGTASSTLFLKGFFDKINAVPQFAQRYEYKNAVNAFTEKDYTPPHREATTRVLQSWYDSATADMAADRKMDHAALIAFLDNSPTVVSEAKDKGLINTIGYDDDARQAALARAGKDAKIVAFEKFAKVKRQIQASLPGPKIAFIHAAGTIVEGKDNGSSPFGGDLLVASDDFAKAIRDATKAPNIKAIVLRVSSPGGDALAADQILDALKKARTAGKPVVVSMGPVAASGGYYISLAADRVVAEPGTLTGSIGVFSGKVAISKSLEMLGLEARSIGVGKNALFLSAIEPWDASQLAKLDQQVDMIYDDFTKKVAAGRKLPLATVLQIARGRVWTGADAKERGLVDELGGFWDAVDAAKKLAGIAKSTPVVFVSYPKPKGWLVALSQIFGQSEESIKAVQGISLLLQSAPVKALMMAIEEANAGRAEMRAMDLPGQGVR